LKKKSPRDQSLKLFLKELKLNYHKLELYNTALCHKSYLNENRVSNENNEKMEFLGDSVLGFIITEYLYKTYPQKTEGELAKIKSYIVSEKSLSSIARNISLPDYILVGKGEELSGGRNKETILGDLFEAFIGAYYLDNGIIKVKEFILRLFIEEIDKTATDKHELDYKTLLQELIQKKHKECPVYRIINENGPEHEKTFTVNVTIASESIGTGVGKSKKEAERNAAQAAYKKLTSKQLEVTIDNQCRQ